MSIKQLLDLVLNSRGDVADEESDIPYEDKTIELVNDNNKNKNK